MWQNIVNTDQSGTPNTTLPVTPRAKKLVNLRKTTPGTPKIPGYPSSKTPRDIKLLSPGIDSSSSLSISSKSVKPERIPPTKSIVTDIRKVAKLDKEAKLYDPKPSI